MASLQGIRETTKYRIRIKSKDSRGLTRWRSDKRPACPNIRIRYFKFH